jgi:predicted Zn-dependent peptidase
MNSMMEYTVKNGYGVKENLLAVAGFTYGSDMSLGASVPSGNLGPALHQLRWYFEAEEWRSKFERKSRAKSWSKAVKKDSKYPETWASRMQMSALLPDHPLGNWLKPEDYDLMKTWTTDELKEWYYTKWQPANAELYIVGKLDVKETEELVRTYMESWSYRGSGTPGELDTLPPPPAAPERQVLIFDKPIATQSQVSLMCHIDAKDRVQEKGKAQVVGDVLSQMAWRKLREEAGVTYGAGAYAMQWDGGTAALSMNSLVQNDAVSFAVNTMFDIIATGTAGDVSEQPIADAAIKRAREYVLGQ